jgi:hypothetical protein
MNQTALIPTRERSINAQKIAMPKEITSEHKAVRVINAANRIPKTLLADEMSKKCRHDGTAITRAHAQKLKQTTTDHKNSLEATPDTSQLNLTSSPFAGYTILSAERGRVGRTTLNP